MPDDDEIMEVIAEGVRTAYSTLVEEVRPLPDHIARQVMKTLAESGYAIVERH